MSVPIHVFIGEISTLRLRPPQSFRRRVIRRRGRRGALGAKAEQFLAERVRVAESIKALVFASLALAVGAQTLD